jgi:hypothetical protein
MPLSRSFLGRVTKYVPRHRLDPAENRLTEVTAGVLEHVTGFAAPFVASMLDFAAEDLVMRARAAAHGERCALQQRATALRELCNRIRAYGDWRVEVRTQVGTSSGRFVDLEIRLRPELLRHDTDLVFWIEVKHGAPVHGDQLEAYEREIPHNGVVLVVAPLQSMPEYVPTYMPVVPWQRLAGVVRRRRRRAGLGTSEYFILDAYAAFLREEGLMDDALTTSHALALEHHAGAEQVLTRLCQLVDPNVEDRWGEREDQHKSYRKVKYEQGWWATYPLQRRGGAEPPSTWRGAFLGWELCDDSGLGRDARNTTAFVAGASMWFEDNPVAISENAGWVSDRRTEGFAAYEGDYQRMWAFLYPEQLLVETTLEGQARHLADWVVGRFEALTAVPPPR